MGMLSEDRSCDECYGSGDDHDGSKCWHCHGTGRRLTELGREVIALLKTHFVLTPKVKD